MRQEQFKDNKVLIRSGICKNKYCNDWKEKTKEKTMIYTILYIKQKIVQHKSH